MSEKKDAVIPRRLDEIVVRYFLVSFSWSHGTASGFGSIAYTYKGHPSETWIIANCKQSSSGESIVIMNIHEFKNKIDYEAYAEVKV